MTQNQGRGPGRRDAGQTATHRRLADVVDEMPGPDDSADDVPTQAGSGDTPAEGAGADGGTAGRWVERWLPPGSARRPLRPRLVVGAAVGVVVALGIVLAVVLGRPSGEEPPPLPVAHEKPATSASPSAADTTPADSAEADGSEQSEKDGPQRLVVSVVGKVRDPGLVQVRAGARVADAIEAAGGARGNADLMSVNLARKLVDGEQLYVGVPVPPGVDSGTPSADEDGEAGGDEPIELNSADADELESLSGVGEVTAQRILDWRTDNGGFTAVEELREIDGIGAKRFEELRDQVTVE